MRPLSLRTKRILLACSAVVVGVLLAECGLRIAGIGYPLPYMPDPYCGTRLQPGFEAWIRKEGCGHLRVNRSGFRDRDHSRQKPPNTFRIAVLGDSFAEALQVREDETFWYRLERHLQKCSALAGRTIEVLNFGVSGYGTAQELLVLRHYVWDYEPDLVLLAFTAGNDVRNNFAPLEPVKARPFFHLKGNRLELDDSFLQDPDYRKSCSPWTKAKVALINGSRVLQLVNEIRNRSSAGARRGREELGLDDHIYCEPSQESWRDAWALTEALISQMHDEVRERNARFLVATMTGGKQIHPDPEIRREYCRRLGVADLLYAERRLQALGEQEGFPVINLAEPMQKFAEERQVFLHGFENTVLGEGHWNAEGHRLAGRLLAEAICRLLSGPAKPVAPLRQ